MWNSATLSQPPEGAEPGGAEFEGAESAGAEPEGAEPGGTEPDGAEPGVLSLRVRSLGVLSLGRTRLRSGAAGARGFAAGGTGAGGAVATSAPTRGTGAAGAGGVGGAGAGDLRAGDPRARGTGPGGAGAGGAGVGDPGAGGAGARGTSAGGAGAGGTEVGDSGAGGTGAGGTGDGGAGAKDPGTEGGGAGGTRAGGAGVGGTGAGGAGAGGTRAGGFGAGGGTDAGGIVHLLCPQPHQSQPQLQPDSPLPAPSPYAEQINSLTERREPESRPASRVRTVCTGCRVPHPRPPPVPGTHTMALPRAASPTVPRLLDTVVTDPLFESTAASALVAELVDFAITCRLDNATALVAESESDCPPSIRGECALGTDVLEDRKEDFECLAADVPHLVAMLLAPEGDPDAPDIPTPFSYAEAITVDGMWIFRVKRPPGSPPVFKARYVARGFDQRQGVDFFQSFSPTPNMTTLQVLLHVAAQHDYELHSLDFCTTFLQGSLHEEMWLRRPPRFTGSFPASLGFTPLTADPSLFLRTDTSLPPFYVLVYVDDLVFATVDTDALALVKSELSFITSASGTPPHSPLLYLQVTRSQLHLWTSPSSCEAEIHVGAMAAQELCWLTYLRTYLGERPRPSPVQFLDNKAMIALC
ncbi:unnamed protein product [Closterium sp. NIES-53]